ncbi:MAG TPA: hypothetical protein VGM37_05090 [Armatimonadota bacterium]
MLFTFSSASEPSSRSGRGFVGGLKEDAIRLLDAHCPLAAPVCRQGVATRAGQRAHLGEVLRGSELGQSPADESRLIGAEMALQCPSVIGLLSELLICEEDVHPFVPGPR